MPAPLSERWATYQNAQDEAECWPWAGPVDGRGYPYLTVAGQRLEARLIAFELGHDWRPKRVRACPELARCTNPAHLTPA